MLKETLKKNKGITLIALVVTIIVLLILAGISIASLTGNNGILTQANKAKEETRGATVEEVKEQWEVEKEMSTEAAKTLDEILNGLVEEKQLTEEEKQEVLDTGKVTIGSKTIIFTNDFLIADVVKVGDFVDYKAGIWTQNEIDNLGSLYSGESLPTTAGKFGGFKAGDSKDNSIETSTEDINKYSHGWRVLSVDSETNTVQLIHAGTPEGYYQGYNGSAGYDSYYIFTGEKVSPYTYKVDYRKWSEYENLNYAVEGSARMPRYSELLNLKPFDLKYIGAGYWYADVNGGGWTLSCYIDSGTNYTIGNICLGIRPVITLKSNVRIKNSDNDGSTPDKAHILAD